MLTWGGEAGVTPVGFQEEVNNNGIQSQGCSHLACMGSLGLPVHTKVLAGTEESSRPFKRAGDAQDALDVVAEADLEDTFKKKCSLRRHIPFVAKLFI